MNQQASKCETTDMFACEEVEEGEPKMCELDQAKTYKGLVGIFVDDSFITFIDGFKGKLYYRGYVISVGTEYIKIRDIHDKIVFINIKNIVSLKEVYE